MRGRGDGTSLAAGGPARHSPVLREEVLVALAPRPGGTYVDGTFGAGGYTRSILAIPDTRVVALDRDPGAVETGLLLAASEPRLAVQLARFGTLDEVLDGRGIERVDGIALDVGVSSMQLDEAGRGFSFRFDGPLDMRMSRTGPSAADLVNGADEGTLADILYRFGEERASRRIARAIVHDRRTTPFTSTTQLADLVRRLLPRREGDIDPATRTFQALRIAVNDELGELVRGLEAAEKVLAPGGRLVVVAFHSLEDRIVKRFLHSRSGRGLAGSRHLPGEPRPSLPTFVVEGRQPVTPGVEEAVRNPRARSAKLRFGTRTDAPSRGPDKALRALSALNGMAS